MVLVCFLLPLGSASVDDTVELASTMMCASLSLKCWTDVINHHSPNFVSCSHLLERALRWRLALFKYAFNGRWEKSYKEPHFSFRGLNFELRQFCDWELVMYVHTFQCWEIPIATYSVKQYGFYMYIQLQSSQLMMQNRNDY